MNDDISSSHNPKIKFLDKLYSKASVRRREKLFPVEGAREISRAIKSGYILETLYYCLEIEAGSEDATPKSLKIEDKKVIYITKNVFEKLAYRDSSDGMIGVFRSKEQKLGSFHLSANPFIIILETVEKPGNLGAILRTADAAGVDGVIVCDPQTDLYNPNVVRSSVGCVFSVPTAIAASDEVLLWLKDNGITPYAAALTAQELYSSADFTSPSAIVMGSEADGLTDFWLKNARQIKIPMHGIADSLNVSVSTAVLTFEAMRQRRPKS